MGNKVERILTPVFRVSFPSIFEAQSYQGSEPKFSVTAVWDAKKFTTKDKAAWAKLLKAMDKASMESFKKPWKSLPANFKKGIRDGEEKADLEGFGEGTKFANLSSKMAPGVVDSKRLPISADHGNTEELYAGCFARATVSVYTYDNVGKGVSLGLFNIQKIADGKPLSSRTDASSDFGDDVDEDWLDESILNGDDIDF